MKRIPYPGGSTLKFLMYAVVVVLINAAAVTLFFRLDLTKNRVYSLSEESRDAVASLSDPLTIKVFFTENLPAPYNNLERYLRDLLREYAVAGNRHFNYTFYDISDDDRSRAAENREAARNYGIHPVQIQNIEQDQVRFQRAYMGMVLIQGNAVEKIPTITTTEGLEYTITGMIRRLNNKISALLNLPEPVEVLLFLSSSLEIVGPYLNLPGLGELPGRVEAVVEKLNVENYGKLAFRSLDPSLDPDAEKEAERYGLLRLHWESFQDRTGRSVPAGKGYAGLVVRHGDRAEEIRLLQVIRIPIFGTRYELMDPDRVETAVRATVENLININEEIGVLVSHGALDPGSGFVLPGQEREGEAANLGRLLGESYSVRRIDLKQEPIPQGLPTLLIAGPRETFSEYELYQIDQFLMQGRNLLLFVDPFKEVMPGGASHPMMRQQGPVYLPVDTGLEKLLRHYGIETENAYVLDERCFKQRIPQQFGGGEQPIYFAPIIEQEWINRQVSVLRNIKGLVMLKAAPLWVNQARVAEQGLTHTPLVSSSDRSWEMRGRIDLNPMLIHPPGPEGKRESQVLASALEGRFTSYFADRPVPEKPEESVQDAPVDGGPSEVGFVDMPEIETVQETLKKGHPGRLFLAGTSEILKDGIIDPEGRGPNAQFVLNVIDLFNGREARAEMRSKGQRFNPLREIPPGTRTAIKTVNIAGLPVIVVAAGLLVWFRRRSRKQTIRDRFSRLEKGAGV